MRFFKRKLIQLMFLIFQNPFIQNFLNGRPYAGPTKSFCTPGLHCYSCPAMAFSCPLGTIQYIIKYASIIPVYALGSLLAVASLFGTATCGYFCPFGFLQDILYKISPFKTVKKIHPILRYTKWFVLIVFVILMPALHLAQGFCAYICPSGTLTAGIPILLANPGYRASIGITFYWKFSL